MAWLQLTCASALTLEKTDVWPTKQADLRLVQLWVQANEAQTWPTLYWQVNDGPTNSGPMGDHFGTPISMVEMRPQKGNNKVRLWAEAGTERSQILQHQLTCQGHPVIGWPFSRGISEWEGAPADAHVTNRTGTLILRGWSATNDPVTFQWQINDGQTNTAGGTLVDAQELRWEAAVPLKIAYECNRLRIWAQNANGEGVAEDGSTNWENQIFACVRWPRIEWMGEQGFNPQLEGGQIGQAIPELWVTRRSGTIYLQSSGLPSEPMAFSWQLNDGPTNTASGRWLQPDQDLPGWWEAAFPVKLGYGHNTMKVSARNGEVEARAPLWDYYPNVFQPLFVPMTEPPSWEGIFDNESVLTNKSGQMTIYTWSYADEPAKVCWQINDGPINKTAPQQITGDETAGQIKRAIELSPGDNKIRSWMETAEGVGPINETTWPWKPDLRCVQNVDGTRLEIRGEQKMQVVLQSSTNLASGWKEEKTLRLTNGMVQTPMASTNQAQFYRLAMPH